MPSSDLIFTFQQFSSFAIHFIRFAAEIRPSYDGDRHFLPRGDITNFTELIDVNNNFDPVTGIFSVKEDGEEGVYTFDVTCRKYGNNETKAWIEIFKNQDVQNIFAEEDVEHYGIMSFVFTLHLQKGDEVTLNNKLADSVYVGGFHPFAFNGNKI